MKCAALFVLSLLNLPLMRWEVEMLFSDFETGHRFVPFWEIIRIQLFSFSFGYSGILSVIGGVLLLAFFVKGFFESIYFKEFIFPILFLLPIVGLFIISLGMPIYTDRYLIYTALPFLIMVSHSISKVFKKSKWLGRLIVIFIVISNISVFFRV